MQPFKARVHNGRIVLDEPTGLPEGQVVHLVPLEEADEDGIVPAERRCEPGMRRFRALAFRPGALQRFLDERR
jgi:hypothetical protein